MEMKRNKAKKRSDEAKESMRNNKAKISEIGSEIGEKKYFDAKWRENSLYIFLFCIETNEKSETKQKEMFWEAKRSENIYAMFCLKAKRKIGSKLSKRSEKIDAKYSLKHPKWKQKLLVGVSPFVSFCTCKLRVDIRCHTKCVFLRNRKLKLDVTVTPDVFCSIANYE